MALGRYRLRRVPWFFGLALLKDKRSPKIWSVFTGLQYRSFRDGYGFLMIITKRVNRLGEICSSLISLQLGHFLLHGERGLKMDKRSLCEDCSNVQDSTKGRGNRSMVVAFGLTFGEIGSQVCCRVPLLLHRLQKTLA